jgi:hypothetical protein
MDSNGTPKKVLYGKFYGKAMVQLGRKDSLLLLNITGWRRSEEDRNICRHATKEAKAQCGLSCY